MMAKKANSESRERVLLAAEKLFHEKGYKAVSMNDIAKTLKMQKASLYHHAPQGKEQLFFEIAERKFKRHQQGIQDALESAENDIENQLNAVASWFCANAPLALLPMMHNDMPEISEEKKEQLDTLVFQTVWFPVMQLFMNAQHEKSIKPTHPGILTGAFISIMDGLTHIGINGKAPFPMDVMAKEAIHVLLHGVMHPPTTTPPE